MFKRSMETLERGRPCVHHPFEGIRYTHTASTALDWCASVSAHQLLQLTRWQFKVAARWSLRTKMQSCTVPRRTQPLHSVS